MKKKFQRRGFLAQLLALCAWPLAPARAADADAVEAMVLKVTGGAAVQSGRVKLELLASVLIVCLSERKQPTDS